MMLRSLWSRKLATRAQLTNLCKVSRLQRAASHFRHNKHVRHFPVVRCFSTHSSDIPQKTLLHSCLNDNIDGAPPLSCTYARLEARLPVSSITPTEALELLSGALPAVHHLGVVQHLVRVIDGNACCLDPDLCIGLMSRLLFPTLPRGFRGDAADEDPLSDLCYEQDGAACTGSTSPLEEVAVRLTLDPLSETLVTCVMTHLQLQLHDPPTSAGEVHPDEEASRLWYSVYSSVWPNVNESQNERRATTAPTTIVDRAAVLVAFVLPLVSAQGLRKGYQASIQGNLSAFHSRCTSLVNAVVRRLVAETAKRHVARGDPSRAALVGEFAFLRAPEADETGVACEGSQWRDSFSAAARRCWHWSILVCRATPVLSSRSLRAFTVDSLVEALDALHHCLLPLTSDPPSCTPAEEVERLLWLKRRYCGMCVEVLSWLLTRSLPVLRFVAEGTAPQRADGSETLPASVRSLQWTARLHAALLALANTFADLSSYVLQNNASNAQVATAMATVMTSVAFRLCFRSAAVSEGSEAASTPQHPRASAAEVNVAGRLLDFVLAMDLRLASSVPSPTPEMRKGECSCATLVTEKTWCRLACVQHVVWLTAPTQQAVVRCTREDDGESKGGFIWKTDEHARRIGAYEKLLRVGVEHLSRSSCSTLTPALNHRNYDKHIGTTDGGKRLVHLSNHLAEPTTNVSLDFVFSFVKCWRAWLVTCLDGAGDAAWLCGVEGSLAEYLADCVARRTEGARDTHSDASRTSTANAAPSTDGSAVMCEGATRSADLLALMGNLRSSLHQLSLWIVEAWAAALDVGHDRSAVDVCACWSALSSPSLALPDVPSRPPGCPSLVFDAMVRTLAACERRLSRQCGEYLHSLRNFQSAPVASASRELSELRPRLYSAEETPRGTVGMESTTLRSVRPWQPVFSPVFISHISVRLLNPVADAASLPPTQMSEDDDGSDDNSVDLCQLPMSETALETLCRTINGPLSKELVFFQLFTVSAYVAWCDAAAVHAGWCRLSVEACASISAGDDEDDSDGVATVPLRPKDSGAPWFLLSVEGVPSASGLPNAPDAATLVFLWSLKAHRSSGEQFCLHRRNGLCPEKHTAHGLRCQYMAVKALPVPHERISSAVFPFVAAAQLTGSMQWPPSTRASASAPSWLRGLVDRWTRRYALRLLLFLIGDESWQRYRKVHTSHSPSSLLLPGSKGGQLIEYCRGSRVHTGQRRHTGRRQVGGVDAALQSTLVTTTALLGNKRGFEWHSEALQPLLCSAARCLQRRIERLSVDVQRAQEWPSFAKASTADAAYREIVQCIGKVKGEQHRTAAKVRSSISTCTQSILLSLFEDDRFVSSSRSPAAPAQSWSEWNESQFASCTRAEHVRHLEERLRVLGLVVPRNVTVGGCISHAQRRAREDEHFSVGEAMHETEEAWALLVMMSLSPELTYLTSPAVLQFVDALWCGCWSGHLRISPDTKTPQPQGSTALGIGSEDLWQNSALSGEIAELDALVSCRVQHLATRRFHALAEELVEYLYAVYVPALRSSSSPETALCFLTTPTEALERQLTESDAAGGASFVSAPATHHTDTTADTNRSEREAFRFSSAALRTYEVLCLSRYGHEERRGPCVWRRWMRELAHEDAALHSHRLVHLKSRLVQ